MNAQILLDAIGEINDNHITEAHAQPKTARRNTIRRKVAAAVSIAASICIMITCCFYILGRFNYLGATCGATPGIIVDGTYYYNVRQDGLYCYTPGGQSEKLLSTFWYDSWNVNDYGVYYKYGRSLYIIPHGTGKSEKLYTSSITQSSHIGFTLFSEGNVIVTIYNKYRKIRSEVLLDDKTGETVKVVMEPSPYGESILYSHSVFRSGERTVELSGKYMDPTVDLKENGVSIFPNGYTVFEYPDKFGDIIVFRAYDEINGNIANIGHLFVVRPDGNDTFLTLNYDGYLGNIEGATHDGRYLFTSGSNIVNCVDSFTGEIWELTCDAEHDFCDVSCDGNYIYTCAPWNDIQTCWKIVYAGDKPTAMQLVAQNIIP